MARTTPLLPTLRPYLLAAAASLLALALAALTAPHTASGPLLAFLAAVAVSAWYSGFGPGLLATAFGTAALSVFFAPDDPSVAYLRAETVLDLVAFAAAATALSLLARSLHTALLHAAAAQTGAQEARDRLAVILDGIADGVTVQDPSGQITYTNEAGARAMGFPSAAAMAETSGAALLQKFTLVDETGNPFPLDRLPGRVALGGADSPETLLGYRSGETGATRWSVVKARPVRDATGRITAAINIFRDVTEERRAAERQRLLAETSRTFAETGLDLQAALDQLTRRVVDTLGDTCLVRLLSADGEWLEPTATYHPNPEAQAFGDAMLRAAPQRRTEGINGRVMTTGQPVLIPVVDQQQILAAIKPEYRSYYERFGTHSILVVPLRAQDRPIGIISAARETPGRPYTPDDLALLQELADRAAVTIDNARLYHQAQDAISVRDQFLLVAAHELRTPVTGLRGFSQLLLRAHQRGALDAARLERYLPSLDESAERLVGLTEDLLDVSRLHTGRLPLRPEPLDLAALARRVAERYREIGAQHHLVLDLAADPAPVRADPGRLEQVLANLLDNAVKYSPDGGEVHLSVAAEGPGFALRVRDQGIGLPPESAEAIFEPFTRAPNAADRQIPGLGLGLHIAREIASRHGGYLRAASAGDTLGTTMTLWLPLDDGKSEE
ncbi:MAG: ATP-binding protein [Thermomicrobiales bacterium]